MPTPRSRKPAFLGAAGFALVAWGSAAAYVAAHDGFGSGDLVPFALWTSLLALPAYPALRLFDRLVATWRPSLAFLGGAVVGSLGGFAATFLATLLLGGWLGAFSFPVLRCWLAGGLSACALVVFTRHPTRSPARWPLALLAVALPLVGLTALLATLSARPPDLFLLVRADATQAEIESIWEEVLDTPDPSDSDSPLDAIESVGRADHDGRVVLRVSFRPGTSLERRAQVVELVRASPLIADTTDGK